MQSFPPRAKTSVSLACAVLLRKIIAKRPIYFSYKSRGAGIGGWDGGHDVVGFVPPTD